MSIASRLVVLAGVLFCVAFAAGYTAGAQSPLPSGLFVHERLPVRESGATRIRQMLTGVTHSGFRLDLHTTQLSAGNMPHTPHNHVHEELLLIRKGTLEVTVGPRTERVGAGSAVYVASGEQHGWRNVGSTPSEYFVLALGDDPPAAKAPR